MGRGPWRGLNQTSTPTEAQSGPRLRGEQTQAALMHSSPAMPGKTGRMEARMVTGPKPRHFPALSSVSTASGLISHREGAAELGIWEMEGDMSRGKHICSVLLVDWQRRPQSRQGSPAPTHKGNTEAAIPRQHTSQPGLLTVQRVPSRWQTRVGLLTLLSHRR